MRKAVVMILCALAMAVACCGCGGNNTSKKKSSYQPVDKEKLKAEGYFESAIGLIRLQSDGFSTDFTVTSTADFEISHTTSAVLMVSDEQYLYLAYRNKNGWCGLYRIDNRLESIEMIDRGLFSYLTLRDGILYYLEEENGIYNYLDTSDLSGGTLTQENYMAMRERYHLDTGNKYPFPTGVVYWVVSGDKSYFINRLAREELYAGEVFPDNGICYSLSYINQTDGTLINQRNRWQSELNMKSIILPYGNQLLYTRMIRYEDDRGFSHYRFLPCFYDPATQKETVLLRSRTSTTFNHDCYVIGATADYLLYSDEDNEFHRGANWCLEKINNSFGKQVFVNEFVKEATVNDSCSTQALGRKKYLYGDEPYGPEESSISLSAPADRSAAFRLVRMDGTTEFMILLKPGESRLMHFPYGRYVLKIAYGEQWISDDEAFGENGDYNTTDVYRFEKNKLYHITVSQQGGIHKDNRNGFTK